MTEDELRRLEARIEEDLWSGPYIVSIHDGDFILRSDGGADYVAEIAHRPIAEAIAEILTAAPDLIAEVRRLREGWRPVVGWEDYYEVSRNGVIRRKSDNGIVGTWLSDQGYVRARLSNPRAQVRVHRVVAEAHVPKKPGADVVDHINFDRADNRAENLQWLTQKENILRSLNANRMPQQKHWAGCRAWNAKLSFEDAEKMREMAKSGRSHSEIAKAFNVHKATAGRIIRGERYKTPTPPEDSASD